MKLLANWTIRHGAGERKIELLHGDLARLPADHAVDVLVVSAFPNDYAPTRGSLIGALDRVGLSVLDLAKDKKADLRQQYSCWLSKSVSPGFNFRRILCIESGWRGTPPEITDDLFRALAPYLLTDFQNSSVAMPLIGAGNQGWPSGEMLQAILRATVGWIERGLPLRLLKIVVFREDMASGMLDIFAVHKRYHRASADQLSSTVSASPTVAQYDVFLSYAHEDMDIAMYVVEKLRELSKGVKIFYDQTISEGTPWLMQIAGALDLSRRVVALFSPSYWASKNCQMEFLAAFTKQIDTDETILFPLYLSEAKIPYMFQNLQYSDCRVNDRIKVTGACSRLAVSLAQSV